MKFQLSNKKKNRSIHQKSEKNLNGRENNSVLKNTKRAIGKWLSHEIIFQKKTKEESDVINIFIKNELEILENYYSALLEIQNKHNDNLRKNPDLSEIDFIKNDSISKKFKAVYEKVFNRSKMGDFSVLEQQMICLNIVINIIKQYKKRQLNKNNLLSTSLEYSDSEESQAKKLKK